MPEAMHNYAAVGGGHAQSSTVFPGVQVLRHVHPRPETLVRSIDTHVHTWLHIPTHPHIYRAMQK